MWKETNNDKMINRQARSQWRWQDEGREENKNRTVYKELIVVFVLMHGVKLYVLHIHTAGK